MPGPLVLLAWAGVAFFLVVLLDAVAWLLLSRRW